jgi:hypothetical protein
MHYFRFYVILLLRALHAALATPPLSHYYLLVARFACSAFIHLTVILPESATLNYFSF